MMGNDRLKGGRPLAARLSLVLMAAALLGGCGSDSAEPVGIGHGVDELKRSPCACMTVPQDFGPGWREDVLRRLGETTGRAS